MWSVIESALASDRARWVTMWAEGDPNWLRQRQWYLATLNRVNEQATGRTAYETFAVHCRGLLGDMLTGVACLPSRLADLDDGLFVCPETAGGHFNAACYDTRCVVTDHPVVDHPRATFLLPGGVWEFGHPFKNTPSRIGWTRSVDIIAASYVWVQVDPSVAV